MSKAEIGETILLFLAIASLWPSILGWDHILAKGLPFLFLPIMIWMARKRFRRFQKALKEAYDREKMP